MEGRWERERERPRAPPADDDDDDGSDEGRRGACVPRHEVVSLPVWYGLLPGYAGGMERRCDVFSAYGVGDICRLDGRV